MEKQADDFKWFGEGFDGFPKILPDDCVEYAVHIINPKLKDLDMRKQLRTVQTAANSLCKDLLKDFIWQRDGFKLGLLQQNGHSFLQGRTNFGDSIEDEWLIVYLLRQLSSQFPQSWIRIFDSDGEFLLIEAADALPKWLNPEVAENRVWIHGGKLLIIPRMQRDQKAHLGALTLDDALAFIQDRSVDLLHDTSVESEAFYRTQKYPAQIKSSLHHAVVTIPRRLAYVLHQNPAYISPAVEAFYLRDPIALRPLQSRRSQTFFFAPEDFVTVSVKFTKVGYAQLRGQEFETPPAWAGSATNNPREDQSAKQMGMKLTCGFEMLLSDPQNVDKKPVREMKLLLEDLIAGDEQLPSNDDISRWECIQDDESWLDINFEDFERELSGTGDQIPLRGNAGFGDRTAHDNLRKIVARFENFLKDEDELAEDAEFLDDMDNDDGSDTADGTASHDSESDNGEREGDFDEARFASMMRDMMGLPPSAASDTVTKNGPKADSGAIIGESDGSIEGESDASIEEEREMRRVMDDMEIELRQAGALSLDPPSTQETLGLTNS